MNYAESPAHVVEVPLWREAFHFYASHAALIVKVLLPPTIIAYLSALAIEYQIAFVRRDLHMKVKSVLTTGRWWAYERISLPLQSLTILKQWFLWVCYCFALIGICKLVSDRTGTEPEPGENVFADIRENPFRFLKAATLFFGVLLLAFAMTTFISFGIINLQLRAHLPYSVWLDTFLPMALVSAVLVRWAFAVPLAVLRGRPFGTAMRASDRLTDNRVLPLWSLVMESEISGYLALIAPSYILFYLHVPQTQFTYYGSLAAALLLSATTQAPLMIGIGLILSKSKKEEDYSHHAELKIGEPDEPERTWSNP